MKSANRKKEVRHLVDKTANLTSLLISSKMVELPESLSWLVVAREGLQGVLHCDWNSFRMTGKVLDDEGYELAQRKKKKSVAGHPPYKGLRL